MQMQLAIFCLLAVSMVMANDYINRCTLLPCGQRLGVFYVTLTRSGRNSSISEVLTFHSDGYFNGIASNQDARFSSFEGTWRCTGANTVEATDFLFDYATATTAARLTKGVFTLQVNANGQVSGTLDGTSYDLASTANSDQSQWIQLSTVVFNVKGYRLLNRCV